MRVEEINVNPTILCPSNKVKCAFSKNLIAFQICHPIILFGQILGLISFDLEIDDMKKTKKHLCRTVLCWIYKGIAASLVLFVVISFGRNKVYIKHGSLINVISNKVCLFLELSFPIVTYSFCVLKARNFYKLLKLLGSLEHLLEGVIKKNKFLLQQILLQCLFTIISISSWVAFSASEEMTIQGLFDSLFIFISNLSELYIVAFFITAAALCSEGFSSHNQKMEEIMTLEAPFKSDCLDQVFMRYDVLHRVGAALQDTFSFLLSAELLYRTLFICFDSYNILTVGKVSLYNGVITLGLLLSIYRIYTVTAAAGSVTTQAKEGLESLHNIHCKKISNSEENQNLWNNVIFHNQQILLLSNKLSQQPIEITTVGNLFTINKNMFTAIMGTTLTYLIVLMQFRPLNPTNGSETNLNASNVHT